MIDLATLIASMEDPPTLPFMKFINTLEMPVINPMYASKHHCFVYGLAAQEFQDNRLVKKDVCQNGRGDRAWGIPNHIPSEPWFEPDPTGRAGDDGIALSVVLNGDTENSYLLFLDGRSFTYINSAKLPTWIPQTFHGRFFH